MGQACSLQRWRSTPVGQILPPKPAEVRVRTRFWEPPPHEVEQAPQACQDSTTQLVGQDWVLQSWTCSLLGQSLPPYLGERLRRVRVWEPVPHERVQEDQ